ncbi:hypothetical protein A2954_01570 [Candidatus Roizmanbacteria bacterium RIFCSPLOWO2_01_FULL_37_12]|uniref:Uncharacterized protein n=1 Tax=Candidatus Roizmanbacteria bacterium RIFCSPLOWO2_01_FULL_37_12 TaxID=1802056 RepID=A0A1F7I9Z4_9BACT|nr:MAG: hypothetical protein A2954_01570 [Candidatus Roizmanbacteria bacterium RIFCSPLOWO2_01_FULL_37_12]
MGLPPRQDFDYYQVNIDIQEITTSKQEGVRSCDNSYLELAEKSGQILTLTEYAKNPVSEGQKIMGKIRFEGDEWFGGYFLSGIRILEDIPAEQGKKTPGLNYRYYGISLIVIIVILLVIIPTALFKRKRK